MKVIILAGGLGTRLRSEVADRPKSLAEIAGKPFLYYLLKWVQRSGLVSEFILSVGYMASLVEEEMGQSFEGIPVSYIVEKEQLGTGGALKFVLSEIGPCNEPVFVLNGDTFFQVDISSLRKFHVDNQCDVSVALREVGDPRRHGVAQLEKNRITAFHEKPDDNVSAWINGGIYCLSESAQKKLVDIPLKSFSFEEEILTQSLKDLFIGGLKSEANFIDIGVPEAYKISQHIIPQWLDL